MLNNIVSVEHFAKISIIHEFNVVNDDECINAERDKFLIERIIHIEKFDESLASARNNKRLECIW